LSKQKRRKSDHIRINLEKEVQSLCLSSGFERYQLIHQALPELDLESIDITTHLYDRNMRAPLLISSMTGGTPEAGTLNLRLAEAAQVAGVAMGLGSQRVALEYPEEVHTFRVRQVAPDILLFANLGVVQMNYGYTVEHFRRVVEMVEADGLILHLNPLHEALQEEGNWNWAGLLKKIEALCRQSEVPVIAKEVGWGISPQLAQSLLDAGVAGIDVAGAGGSSWSEVEYHRASTERSRRLARAFAGWGLPTALSLQLVRRTVGDRVPVFASGGIRSGIDAVKALALGADLVGLASPLLRAAAQGTEAVLHELEQLVAEMRIAMFATGAGVLSSLRESGRIQAWDNLWREVDGAP
jgi:isopentenyl-diphosphate delta-isomerase